MASTDTADTQILNPSSADACETLSKLGSTSIPGAETFGLTNEASFDDTISFDAPRGFEADRDTHPGHQ